MRTCLLVLVVVSQLLISGCDDDDDDKDTRSGGTGTADVSGAWSGRYKSLDLPECSGDMSIDFNDGSPSNSGRVSGSYQLMPGSGCAVSRFSGLFSGDMAGSTMRLDDNDGDRWLLSLRSSNRISGEVRRGGTTVAEVSVRRD